MATSFSFGNKTIKIPGSYSRIESGISNQSGGLDFGSLLVIDTGSMTAWGGGAGVSGESAQGKDSIYTFDNSTDAKAFVKGGLWWDLLTHLFKPSQSGIPGISSVSFIRAAATVGATIAYTFTGGGANGGTITFKLKEEGTVGNGVLNVTSGMVEKGFAAKMVAGRESGTFRLRFYIGSYVGLDYAGEEINGISAASSKERLIVESIDFNNITDLGVWAQRDKALNAFFTTTFTATGTGVVTSADLSLNTAYKLATGGTITYNQTHLDSALQAVKDMNVDFILADKYDTNAEDAMNFSILNIINEQMAVKPDLYIGAGDTQAKFAASVLNAETFNSDIVTLVHGGVKFPSRNGVGFKNAPSIYLAAFLLGREAGIAPQIPLTFKGINIQGLTHSLSDFEKETCLDKGVLTVVRSNTSFDVLKGINSLQNNRFLINEDGTSPSKQIKRIARQINKELAILSREQLLKNPLGLNRNTLSETDLKNWVESYLLSITATPQADNLIVQFQDVAIRRENDAYFISYGIVPNTEISFLFFLGTVVSV